MALWIISSPKHRVLRPFDQVTVKKTFSLVSDTHKSERLVEQIKGELKKYLKRERKKKLPEGSDYWAFQCRAGFSQEEATEVHVSELGKAIEYAYEQKQHSVYLEVLAQAQQAPKKSSEP